MLFRQIFIISLLLLSCYSYSKININNLEDLDLSDLSTLLKQTYELDEYLEAAMTLIENEGDLIAAKNCLLKSMTLYENHEAAFLLGKLHLFGFFNETPDPEIPTPRACQTTSDVTKHRYYKYYQGNYTEEQSIESTLPNLTAAYKYFDYSHKLGHADAAVFMYYIYKQNLILQEDKILIPAFDSSAKFVQMFSVSRERGSLYAGLVLANTIHTCNKFSPKDTKEVKLLKNMTRIPGLNIVDIFQRSSLAFGIFAQGMEVADKPCQQCGDALMHLLPVLADVNMHLNENGGLEFPPPRLDAYHQEIVKSEDDVELNTADALEIIKQQAERGDVDSQLDLAEAYFFGNPEMGIERDVATSQRYYQMAAQQNHPHAQNSLAVMKMNGIGTEKNETEAIELLIKSAEQGSANSMNGLAVSYLYGTGVPVNPKIAIEWLEKAAELNHTESEGNLGTLLKWGEHGVKKDEEKALKYMIRAARKGQSLSVLNLATMYIEKLAEPNFDMGISCWEIFKLAKTVVLQGSMNSFQLQAFRNYREKEFDKAYLSYSFGAMLGFEDSAHASAFLWEKNRLGNFKCKLVGPNECAIVYYYQLHLLGDDQYLTNTADLIYNRAQLYNNSEEDLSRAYKLYNYSVTANNDPRALHSLAWMTEMGIGAEKNVSLALQYYQKLASGYLNEKFDISAMVVGLIQLVRLQIQLFFGF